jgi:hypothetical protein
MKEILDSKIWIQLNVLNSKEGLHLFKYQNLTNEDFEILLEIKNWLGLENEICMPCNLENLFEKFSSAISYEIHYLGNFNNSKIWVLQTYPL